VQRFDVSCVRQSPLQRRAPESQQVLGPGARPIWARVGRIVKARGLKGEIKVVPDAGPAQEVSKRNRYYIQEGNGKLSSREVVRIWRQKKALVVSLEGVESREQAESLVGCALYLPKRELPSLPEGTYYHTDLIGTWVWDEQDRYLGVLDSILETGANDVWIVLKGSKELLLPATKRAVKEVNLEEGYIVACPPEWI